MSELSLKSAKSLHVNLGMTIRDLEIATDNIIKAVDELKGMNVANPLILNYNIASIYLNFINLDICAAYRLYISGTTHYEQRYAVKQLYTIMNEGYKRLYGFDNKSQDPLKKNPQKGSVWVNYLSCYAECGVSAIEEAYQSCLSVLERFNDPVIYDKDARCHGAHYSEDYKATYTFLKDLDAEIVTNGATKFFSFMECYRKFISVVQECISSALISCLNNTK